MTNRSRIVFICAFTSLFTCVFLRVAAQNALYGGVEVGVLSDRSHFTGDNGQSLSGGGISGLLGINLGLEYNGYFFSTGFKRYLVGIRVFELDRSGGQFSKQGQSFSSTENFVIPLTVAKEVRIAGGWNVRIGVGILGMLPRSPGNEQIRGWHPVDPDQQGSQLSFTPDSTIISWVTDRKFNMGFETSVEFVYRTGGRVDFFVNTAFQAHLFPLFESNFRYYSEGPVRTGTATGVNTLVFGIGLNYAFLKLRKKNREL